ILLLKISSMKMIFPTYDLQYASSNTLFSFLVVQRPMSTLFPYTTLFRSHPGHRRLRQQPRTDGGIPAPVCRRRAFHQCGRYGRRDRKSTRLNSSHVSISYAVFCVKKKKNSKNQVSFVMTRRQLLLPFIS